MAIKKNNTAIKNSPKHLLGIQNLSILEAKAILDEAKKFIELNRSSSKKLDVLRGKTQINLFFEPSTRTQSSFDLAGKRLGADVMSMNMDNSALKKGETLIDTAMTLNAMHPDLIVIRHQDSGAPNLLSQKVNCAVINDLASSKIKFISEIERSCIPRRCFFEILIAFLLIAIKTNSINF